MMKFHPAAKFPTFKVTCKVAGNVVKESIEVANTKESAIAKLKYKLRGAVSSAGAFVFDAERLA